MKVGAPRRVYATFAVLPMTAKCRFLDRSLCMLQHTSFMRSYKIRSTHDRRNITRVILANMSFDEILDLTAEVCVRFMNIMDEWLTNGATVGSHSRLPYLVSPSFLISVDVYLVCVTTPLAYAACFRIANNKRKICSIIMVVRYLCSHNNRLSPSPQSLTVLIPITTPPPLYTV